MDLPDFLSFRPATLRSRHDGWSPGRQRAFILNLARGMVVSQAARSVGQSRQSAYRLRARPEAAEFAAAWDSALDFAFEVRSAPHRPVGEYGLDTLLVPRFYRGRLVGFLQREDSKGALRRLKQLDRIAQNPGPVSLSEWPEEASFDELIELAVAEWAPER